MIVVRIKTIKGDCDIEGYNDWFVAEGIGFGFDTETKKKKNQNSKGEKSKSSRYTTKASRDVTDTEESKEESAKFSRLSLEKTVDVATCDLMMLAMRDRLKQKVEESKALDADIHFLNVGLEKVTAYMRIHLANVLVKNWSISGSADDRPTESLSLWFDKAAMIYLATEDGITYGAKQQRGWNQTDNEVYNPSKGEAPFFHRDAV